jgi:hypothetical protein
MTALEAGDVEATREDVTRFAFGVARLVSMEAMRELIRNEAIYHPDSDPDATGETFCNPRHPGDEQHILALDIQIAFERCGLSRIEKIVLQTYAAFIDMFNDRDTYTLLTQLLLERYENQLPEDIKTRRRLKSVFIDAKNKLKKFLALEHDYDERHDEGVTYARRKRTFPPPEDG